MGTLSITNTDGGIEVIAGNLVGGELLSDHDYAFRGCPPTDDEQQAPKPKGLEPWLPFRWVDLHCCVCGEWAGNTTMRLQSLDHRPTDNEIAAVRAQFTNSLCDKHWRAKKWAKLPEQL